MTDEPTDATSPIELVNEFAAVRVFEVPTHNGSRLRIVSDRTGSSIDLDPLELESLTWQPIETFSRLLASPPDTEGGDG